MFSVCFSAIDNVALQGIESNDNGIESQCYLLVVQISSNSQNSGATHT